MKTLFISTYNELITIALLNDNNLISQKEDISKRSHSLHLLPLIDDILKENKLKANELNEIIVINGPGSFTGVRLGITVAKTLAYTLNIPIKTINTLDALAISNDKMTSKIVKINDAKGSFYGIYKNNMITTPMNYLNNEAFADFLNKNKDIPIIDNEKLDVIKIYLKLKNEQALNPHEVKPIYLKKIEVLND